MKPYKTLLFIISLFVGLALLSCLFPRNGMQLGGVLWEFPTIASVLGEPPSEVEEEEAVEADTLSPEELLEQRLAALRATKDSTFLSDIAKNPARFYLPDDDVAYLDPLFEALLKARQRPMRIMYFGDSQLECDRITDVLREQLQQEFGGSGAGLLPAVQTIGTTTAKVVTWPELRRHVGFGAEGTRNTRVGPLSQMAVVDGEATFTLSATGGKSFPHCASFRKVSVLMAGTGSLTVAQGDTVLEMTCPKDTGFAGMRIFSRTLPAGVSDAVVRATGKMEVFGIMLDGESGVSLDNIAMRGSSGTHFTSLERSTFVPFFQSQQVALILLEYGGNSLPYLKGGKAISRYKQQMKSQIAYLKSISPGSRIIYVGPADMATGDGENMYTYPQLPQVVDSLRDAALESGVAFWDMYRAMGGRGSMVKWVNARPQLAGEDYIHFTPRGAKRMGHLLGEMIDFYYRYYRFRKGLDKEELPEDTIPNDKNQTSADTLAAALGR